ncbi:MAG TPA: outer membrane lipoprotein-sorting protein [candidate division Zixibacteria bacterium]|nr:outer membrane lipoprotein-sorting protein [candidate division Zixibacteria bacterium]
MALHRFALCALCALAVTLAPLSTAGAGIDPDTLDAEKILNQFDDLFRGSSSHGTMTMTVVTKHWSRTMEMEFWSEGTEKTLIRILAPKKERGTATLKSGNDLWNYLPKVNRVIKLPSSMLSSSWMGSHFNNDDLVKESRMSEDFDFSITGIDTTDGAELVDVTCHPKEEAVVVWGKVVVVFDVASLLPVRTDYYDEEMALVRTMTFADVREIGGRTLPTRMDLIPTDKPDEVTTVIYDDIVYDIQLPDDIFTLRNLKR